MLDPEKVEAVRRLLADGQMSHRQIAETVGMCRGSVSAIASGRRPDYETRRRADALRSDAEEVLGSGAVERCPDCGALAAMPCRACHLLATETIRPTPAEDADCRLQLRPGARKRYEEMRRRRQMSDAN